MSDGSNAGVKDLPMLLAQAPIIREQLRPLKEQVEQEVAEALSLVCTEDTVQTVKAKRAELNQRLKALEDQRKEIKRGVMEPYNAFEEVFRECISDAYKAADVQLKDKIDAVEQEIKQRCEDGLREYFAELCATHHLDWLRFEQAGVNVDMASAKKKTPKKLREQLAAFVSRVADDVATIDALAEADEIMVEYKQSLNFGQAWKAVTDRHQRIAQEGQSRQSYTAAVAQDQEAVRRVEAVAPPVAVDDTPPAEEQVLTTTFTVHGTKAQLIILREFMKQEGIKYE